MADDYQRVIDQVKTLTENRQTVTSTYLSVNTAITGAIAFLLKDGQVTGVAQGVAILVLMASGIVVCDLWRRLLNQYGSLLGWWYEQLRALEAKQADSARLYTREYTELYEPPKNRPHIGLSAYQSGLTWIFTAIYLIFGAAILVSTVAQLLH